MCSHVLLLCHQEETSAKRKVELTEDTIPALKSTEVLIKIRAVSINVRSFAVHLVSDLCTDCFDSTQT